MKNEIVKKINQQIESIPNKRLLDIEAALHLIPHVGGFLATYFGEIRGKRVEERMKKYFDFFSQKMNEIDKSKIDHEYLKSEEFAELFVKGAEQAGRSATDKKISRFANILANNALLNSEERYRTESIMNFVERITDLDSFILIAFGNPIFQSFKANYKEEIIKRVNQLAIFLNAEERIGDKIIESVIYLDNLGLTWVNERIDNPGQEKGEVLILKEFSSFRTPLGDSVVKVITPPHFFIDIKSVNDSDWPGRIVNKEFYKEI
jgi:hypothetical protein